MHLHSAFLWRRRHIIIESLAAVWIVLDAALCLEKGGFGRRGIEEVVSSRATEGGIPKWKVIGGELLRCWQVCLVVLH